MPKGGLHIQISIVYIVMFFSSYCDTPHPLKHASGQTGYAKLPPGVKEYLNDLLLLTGVQFTVYSCLPSSVPRKAPDPMQSWPG